MYIQKVTAEHDYEDLHRSVDQLTPAFAGIFDGPQDLAQQVDDFVAQRFKHSL